MKNIVVLYHNNCDDGFGAAWAAWKKFKNKASYVGVDHQALPPTGLKNKIVYFVDFCYTNPKVMEKIFKENKQVVIIDHHVSQIDVAKKFSTEFVYGDKNSGSVLTWKYFHPGKPAPRFLRHIEDIDLWKFKLPHTKEFIASIEASDCNFSSWDKYVADFENPKKRKKYLEEGKAIVKYQNYLVKLFGNAARPVVIDGQKAFAINSAILDSELGNYLYRKHKAIGIVWYYKNGKEIKVSLRSGDGIDVSKIAKKFGGGGHKAASGFMYKVNFKFPWKNKKAKMK
ncbi:hypothetical protein HZB05_02265 [Candidatus Wolfebacteria bacterium]|nr:hypothetical protein [Candidatus Wolfebacteria bacterium]